VSTPRYNPPETPVNSVDIVNEQKKVAQFIQDLLNSQRSKQSSAQPKPEANLSRYFCCFLSKSDAQTNLLSSGSGNCPEPCRFTSFISAKTDEALAYIIESEIQGSTRNSAFLGGEFSRVSQRAYQKNSVFSQMSGDSRADLLTEFQHLLGQLRQGNVAGCSQELLSFFRDYGSMLSVKQNSHHSPLNYALVRWFFDESYDTKNKCLCFIEKKFVQDDAGGLGADKAIACARPLRAEESSQGGVSIFYLPLPKAKKTSMFGSARVPDPCVEGIEIPVEHNNVVPNGLKLAKGLECYRTLTPELINNGYCIVAMNLITDPYLVFHQVGSEVHQIRFMCGVDPKLSKIDTGHVLAKVEGAKPGAQCHVNENYGRISQALQARLDARDQCLAAAQAHVEAQKTQQATVEMAGGGQVYS